MYITAAQLHDPNYRSKAEYPYSYDPILQYKTNGVPTSSIYTDRLIGWYGYDNVKAKMEEYFGNRSDYYNDRSVEAIQNFLRDLLTAPNLVITRIEEHCNVSTGYPVWFFAFIKG